MSHGFRPLYIIQVVYFLYMSCLQIKIIVVKKFIFVANCQKITKPSKICLPFFPLNHYHHKDSNTPAKKHLNPNRTTSIFIVFDKLVLSINYHINTIPPFCILIHQNKTHQLLDNLVNHRNSNSLFIFDKVKALEKRQPGTPMPERSQ